MARKNDLAEISAGIKDLGQMTKDMGDVFKSMNDSLTAMQKTTAAMVRPLDENAKSIRRNADALKDSVNDLDDMKELYKQISNASSRMKRLEIVDRNDMKAAQGYMDAFIEGYEKVKKSGGAILDPRKMAAVNAQMEKAVELKKRLVKEERNLAKLEEKMAGTSDAGELIRLGNLKERALTRVRKEMTAATEQAQEFKQSISDIDFTTATSHAKKMGSEMERAFGQSMNPLKAIDNYAFKGMFGRLNNFSKTMRELKKTHGKEQLEKLSALGRTKGISSSDSRSMAAGTGGIAKYRSAFAKMDKGEQGEFLKNMSGNRTGVSGWLDRKLIGKTLSAAEGAGGSGGGIIGSLMGQGGGSALEGMSMKMSAAAGPAAIVEDGATALGAIFQMGAKRNKDIYEKLGQGGLIAGSVGADMGKEGEDPTRTGLSDIYQSISDRLSPMDMNPNSAGMRFGATFSDNLDIIAAATKERSTGVMMGGRQTSEQALAPGARADTMFSGILQNAHIFGKGLGMTGEQAVDTTMKWMEQFNASIQQTQEMFVKVGEAVKVTGLSTTKYLNLIDSITSGFDRMNKSFTGTIGLLQILGRNAKYTSEDLAGMVKGILGEKKGLEMSAYAYDIMGTTGQASVRAGALQQEEQGSMELAKKGFNTGKKDQMTDTRLREMVNSMGPQGQALSPEVEKWIFTRALRRGYDAAKNAVDFAAVDINSGGNMAAEATKNLALLKGGLGGGKLSDFMDSQKTAQYMASAKYTEYSTLTGSGGKDALQYLPQALQQFSTNFKDLEKITNTPEEKRFNLSTAEGRKQKEDYDSRMEQIGGPGILKQMRKEAGPKGDLATTKTFNDFIETHMGLLGKEINDGKLADEAKKANENQKFITGPLDYLQRGMTQLVDELMRLCQIVANWYDWTSGKSRAVLEKQGAEYAADEQKDQYSPVFVRERLKDYAAKELEQADSTDLGKNKANEMIKRVDDLNSLLDKARTGQIDTKDPETLKALAVVRSAISTANTRLIGVEGKSPTERGEAFDAAVRSLRDGTIVGDVEKAKVLIEKKATEKLKELGPLPVSGSSTRAAPSVAVEAIQGAKLPTDTKAGPGVAPPPPGAADAGTAGAAGGGGGGGGTKEKETKETRVLVVPGGGNTAEANAAGANAAPGERAKKTPVGTVGS